MDPAFVISLFALITSISSSVLLCCGKITHFKSCCCSIDLNEESEMPEKIDKLISLVSQSNLSEEPLEIIIEDIKEPMSAHSESHLSPKKIVFESLHSNNSL